MKNVGIWSFSGPYFPAFGLYGEIRSISLGIQSECGKIGTRKTPNMATFYAVVIYLVNARIKTQAKENLRSMHGFIKKELPWLSLCFIDIDYFILNLKKCFEVKKYISLFFIKNLGIITSVLNLQRKWKGGESNLRISIFLAQGLNFNCFLLRHENI